MADQWPRGKRRRRYITQNMFKPSYRAPRIVSMLHSSGMTAMKNFRNVNPERLLSFNRFARFPPPPAKFFAKHPRDIVSRKRAYRSYSALMPRTGTLLSRNRRGICGEISRREIFPSNPRDARPRFLNEKLAFFAKVHYARLSVRLLENRPLQLLRGRGRKENAALRIQFSRRGECLCARGLVCGKL